MSLVSPGKLGGIGYRSHAARRIGMYGESYGVALSVSVFPLPDQKEAQARNARIGRSKIAMARIAIEKRHLSLSVMIVSSAARGQ